ncbi:MAG TPA: cell division protein FtsZ, partial [Rubrivivax sp.]|nr:cell division protein FtsZ [Rubrivivax sp.]
MIDAIAPLALDAQVSGAALLAHMPVTRRAGTKVFLVEGLNAEHGQWESPLQSQSYSELQAGVQLASRS